MYQIDMELGGAMALLAEQASLRANRIKTMARAAMKRALQEFGQGTGRHSLDFRFTDAAFSALNLTKRSPRYQAAQTRIFGRPRPFYSPRRKAAHMQNLVRIPGPGHRVSNSNKGTSLEIRGVMKLPGARILNFSRKAGEFVNLTRGGAGYDASSAAALQQRFMKLFLDALRVEIARPRRRRRSSSKGGG